MWYLVWAEHNGCMYAFKCQEIPMDMNGKPYPYYEAKILAPGDHVLPLQVLERLYPHT